jgi:hypothetical protein
VKNIEHATFASCQALTSVKLCEGVKTVGDGTFQDDSTLEMISLPASLDTIDGWAFANCPGLKVIECNGMTPPAMHSDAFINSDLTETSLCVPYGSVDAYRNAPVWKNFKHIGTYPAGIHIISGKNFTVNSGTKLKLTAKLLPHDAVPAIVWTSTNSRIASAVDGIVTAYAPGETVITATTINGIFKDSCKITVKPGSSGLVLGVLGKDYFQDSQNSKHITIPASCTLEDGIFANHSTLETVTVGDNVNFGKEAFRDCINLKSITFSGKINNVTEGMFRGCNSLESIRIPDGVTSIVNHAFDFCNSLQTVNIPAGVTSIGDSTFINCHSLHTVNIPNSVTKIGEAAFQQSGLTTLTIPGSVKDIGVAAFVFSKALTSVKICEGVKTILYEAFEGCENLEKVSLPASLEYVDAVAFAWCYNLKIIECSSTIPPNMNPWVFFQSNLTGATLYVPHGSVDAYRNAPVWKDFPTIVAYQPAGN